MRKINGRIFLFVSSLVVTQLFCITTTVRLSARVYEDLDGNGFRSANEPWFPGVTVEWEGIQETTNENGIAYFTKTYMLVSDCSTHDQVDIQVPAGYYITEKMDVEVNCNLTGPFFKKPSQSDSVRFGLAPILEEAPLEITPTPTPTEEPAVSNPALTLTKTVDHTTCVRAGEQFNYTYVITNTGDVPLTGPFTLTDNKIPIIRCERDLSTLVLQPNEGVACTGIYFSTDVESEIGAVIRNQAVVSVVHNQQVVTSNTAVQEVFCTATPPKEDKEDEEEQVPSNPPTPVGTP